MELQVWRSRSERLTGVPGVSGVSHEPALYWFPARRSFTAHREGNCSYKSQEQYKLFGVRNKR
jgi:hypothetical protein